MKNMRELFKASEINRIISNSTLCNNGVRLDLHKRTNYNKENQKPICIWSSRISEDENTLRIAIKAYQQGKLHKLLINPVTGDLPKDILELAEKSNGKIVIKEAMPNHQYLEFLNMGDIFISNVWAGS